MANALVNRLQFPMTLGSHVKSLDIGKNYLTKILQTRMLKDQPEQKSKDIAQTFVEGYVDHGACILCEESVVLGLKTLELTGAELDNAWKLHGLEKKKRALRLKKRRQNIDKDLGELPPEVLEMIRDLLGPASDTTERSEST